jgi:hypothetical protein
MTVSRQMATQWQLPDIDQFGAHFRTRFIPISAKGTLANRLI